MTTCPKCNNTMGFAFGTCTRCDWNYLDNSYHTIKVDVDYLPKDIKDRLIQLHDKRIKSIYG